MEKALFLGYKGGLRAQRNKQILVKIDHIDDRDGAAKYVGRRVIWKSPRGNILIGKIVGVHGRKGVLRARLRKGLPGQAIGTELTIR